MNARALMSTYALRDTPSKSVCDDILGHPRLGTGEGRIEPLLAHLGPGSTPAGPSRLREVESAYGRASGAVHEVDFSTPVLTPGGALARAPVQRSSPWSERLAYTRAHPYATPPRRQGLLDRLNGDVVIGVGRDKALSGTTAFGREARRDFENTWRRTSATFSTAVDSFHRNGAEVFRGRSDYMGGTNSSFQDRIGTLEEKNGRRAPETSGSLPTFKSFERVNIFGEALKKYVSMKRWDDADSLSRYKALIMTYENDSLAGRTRRSALEKRRALPREGEERREPSLSEKHAATIRNMQEVLKLRRAKLSETLAASTSSSLEEQLERLSVEAQELKAKREREVAARKFLKPLTKAQLEAVQEAFDAPSREILAAGSFLGQGALEVTGKDIATLRTGAWLNDEVANFAIGLLSRRTSEARLEGETQPRFHFFSTFFINKLYQDGGRYEYSNVRRWTLKKRLKYDVLKCDRIYVPIHQSVHWVLAEIDVKNKRISYYDSLLGESEVAVKHLKSWIIDEAKNKLDETWDPDEWIEDYPKNIPLQKNGCDCGVFMIKYADYLSSDAELAFSQKHMEYFRKRMVSDILEVGIEDS